MSAPDRLPDAPTDDAEVAALRALVAGTAHATGEEFFQSLVRHLARAVGVPNAFVAEFTAADGRVRTRAHAVGYEPAPNAEWDLSGSPCEVVLRGQLCHFPTGVEKLFPKDEGVDSYLGVPLKAADGTVLGHLAVYDAAPMPAEPRRLFTFQIFAARAAAELERLRSEERFRDLFDEAPIAYVHEDLESRFLRANKTALRILGVKPEEVVGFVGMSLIAKNPEAQRRVREAFDAISRGADTSGVVLELRRHDNDRPVWIQWWSRPDPSGTFTRTMFLDITDRVLAEQEQARLRQQNLYLQEEIKAAHNFDEIVGASPSLVTVLENVVRVAPTETTVLVTGETGTGKELVARALHAAGKRRGKPLIKVNCAALPASLVESELFGHEKGAFTGATARRQGRFELADGGTLFLDEVGEVPLEVQAKLLRALQEKEIDRVGGTAPVRVDVRVVAATNRDLAKLVREKTFREDLYYRLSVFPIHLPPLRDRAGDVPLLVDFLLKKISARVGRRFDGVTRETMARLAAYPWPGNVRELENVIERAVILSDGPVLEVDPAMLPAVAPPAGPTPLTPAPAGDLESFERTHILTVLQQTRWVIEGPKGAAHVLGLHPNTLRSRLKKLGITRPTHETA
jgi:formate hydrogenlyase transcriptional activator